MIDPKTFSLSIFFPAYYDEKNIGKVTDGALRAVRELGIERYEIMAVLDEQTTNISLFVDFWNVVLPVSLRTWADMPLGEQGGVMGRGAGPMSLTSAPLLRFAPVEIGRAHV